MRDIPGFEGLYAATSCGKIWSHKRKKFLKPELLCNGYYRVALRKDGETIRKRVHTLVAMTYIDNPEGYTEINHKDEVKTNNSIQNLEWCNHKYNVLYSKKLKKERENGKIV